MKNKPRVDYEQRSALGRAVNNFIWEHNLGAVAAHHSSSEKNNKKAGKYGRLKFEGTPSNTKIQASLKA